MQKRHDILDIPVDEASAGQCRSAEPVTTDGTYRSRTARAASSLSPPMRFVPLPSSRENDGSLDRAIDTRIGASRHGVRTQGSIGDGSHSSSGDFDFYRLRAHAGQTVTAKVRASTDALDSALTLYDANGRAVAGADDSPGTTDSTLVHKVADSGTYYLMVSGSGSSTQDPSASGSGTGAASEGPYTLSVSAAAVHTRYYAVRLHAGDLVGAAVSGTPDSLAVIGPDGVADEVSTGDVAHHHPSAATLPSGKLSVDDVAAHDGRYCLVVSGDTPGAYRLKVLATRPALEGTGREQTIFLDFDGARVDPSGLASSGLQVTPGARTTSPLRAFLAAWGLPADAEGRLADAIRRACAAVWRRISRTAA